MSKDGMLLLPTEAEMEKLEHKIEVMFTKQDNRIDKLFELNTTLMKDITQVSAEAKACKFQCELPAYKQEMRGRCETFDTKIEAIKEKALLIDHGIDVAITTVDDKSRERHNANRVLIGRIIGVLVTGVILATGVIGTLQTYKVGQPEFDNHLAHYQADKADSNARWEKFVDTVTENTRRRDDKIDRMLTEQLIFNSEIVKQTGLLEKQLAVIKTSIK
jgi:hypothetical protein